MPREKESYRDNLERLNSFFPTKELLTVSDVAKLCGIDARTATKLFEFKNNYISKAKLAREMS